jgi:3'(2'), 5'-bisphosphate nucleotidase
MIPGGAALLDALTTIVSEAGAAILAARARALDPREKADSSPVTAADEASEAVIVDRLERLIPGIPIVSEEAATAGLPTSLPDHFLLVDPLDGTRELLAGRDEFSVNVALVAAGRPVIGVVAAPASGIVWRAGAGGAERLALAPGAPAGAARQRTTIRTRRLPTTDPVAAVSRSHLDPRTQAFLERLAPMRRLAMGSAIKLAWVAEGSVDVYPRLAPVHEWDLAAGHAVVAAAGGDVTAEDGSALRYGRISERLIVPAFVAFGDPAAKSRLLSPSS